MGAHLSEWEGAVTCVIWSSQVWGGNALRKRGAERVLRLAFARKASRALLCCSISDSELTKLLSSLLASGNGGMMIPGRRSTVREVCLHPR